VIPPNLSYPSHILSSWIYELRKQEGKPIVLLIDECDAPVTAFLPENPEKAEKVAMVLKPFHETIKSRGDNSHKVFITGACKLLATSIFSEPNQFLIS
jgi:hypothetical protein